MDLLQIKWVRTRHRVLASLLDGNEIIHSGAKQEAEIFYFIF
jgi:hypothetical protein